jgi:hypothetical protein
MPLHAVMELNTNSYVTYSEIGKEAVFMIPSKSKSLDNVKVFFDQAPKKDVAVFTSAQDDSKPIDVKELLISHDSINVSFQVILYTPVEEIKNDIFVSMTIDADRNPNTGMPKAHKSSYNMGGEDFMARYSRAYGKDKFILDRWDNGSGDTIETGGLANGKAEKKIISFSIPRRSIGDPAMLDFKLVARTYQEANPDLSEDHITYSFISPNETQSLKLETVQVKNTQMLKVIVPPQSMVGIARFHVVNEGQTHTISNYVVPAYTPTSPWVQATKLPPKIFARMNIKSIIWRIDADKIHFQIDFWDGLDSMGNYDKKMWMLIDSSTKYAGFSTERFCTGKEDYIAEVATENGITVHNLYNAKEGVGGFRNNPLTNVEYSAPKGQINFSISLKKLENPKKMTIFVCAGGWKAPNEDWDTSGYYELILDSPAATQFTKIADDPKEDDKIIDFTTIECGKEEGLLLFRIKFSNDLKAIGGDSQISIFMDTDLDQSTGLPKSQASQGGEDYCAIVYHTLGNFLGNIIQFNGTAQSEVGLLENILYDKNLLTVKIPMYLIGNPKAVRFRIFCINSLEFGKEDNSDFNLTYSISGNIVIPNCNVELVISSISGDGNVKISWKTPNILIAGFMIYRINYDNSTVLLTEKLLLKEETSYTDTTVTNGKSYTYYVRVVCADGSLGSSSNKVQTTPTEKPKPLPRVFVTPQSIELGEIPTSFMRKTQINFANMGPGEFTCKISTKSEFIKISPGELKLSENEKKSVTIEITQDLPSSFYNIQIEIDSNIGKFVVPMNFSVAPGNIGLRYVIGLQAESRPFAVKISWQPPLYKGDRVVRYSITRKEMYKSTVVKTEKVYSVEGTIYEFVDENLDMLSEYTYTVVPVFTTEKGIPQYVTARPTVPFVFILLKVGFKSAVVNETPVELDAAPFVHKGRTMVPLRFIGENLFAKVSYDTITKTATFTRGNTVVVVKIGSEKATVDSKEVKLDPPAMIKDGRTFVPVRFIADAFGAKTTWEPQTKQIGIIFP